MGWGPAPFRFPSVSVVVPETLSRHDADRSETEKGTARKENAPARDAVHEIRDPDARHGVGIGSA